MGHVFVEAELSGKRRRRVRLLVDTGATFTFLPAGLAKALGVSPSSRSVKIQMVDGSRRLLKYGSVLVKLEGREVPATAIIGPAKSEPVLGVEALEALGLSVDPKSGTVRPTRAHAALLVGFRSAR